jgi:hypothetical protein
MRCHSVGFSMASQTQSANANAKFESWSAAGVARPKFGHRNPVRHRCLHDA